MSSFTALLLNNFSKLQVSKLHANRYEKRSKGFVKDTDGFHVFLLFYCYVRDVFLWRGRLQLSKNHYIARPG